MDDNGLVEVDDRFRLQMVDTFLILLRKLNDLRSPDAIAHYWAQREELVKRIQASNPPARVVQANVGILGSIGGNHG